MQIPIHAISLRHIVPTDNGAAIFLSATPKTFVIHTATDSARALAMTLDGKATERPLTHEFIRRVFLGFEISVDHVLLTKVENGVFFCKIRLMMKNELGAKVVEIDARPSDALILAAQEKRPLFATQSVIDNAEDMSEMLKHINKIPSKPQSPQSPL
ncbi:MAG: bifunctional nuclease family protein [Puniceicoccales bacterium]|jgi:bifunctional DNase/RNase|nr:bifunctional nuclease family protein [Puniceicoccales bacterium]